MGWPPAAYLSSNRRSRLITAHGRGAKGRVDEERVRSKHSLASSGISPAPRRPIKNSTCTPSVPAPVRQIVCLPPPAYLPAVLLSLAFLQFKTLPAPFNG